MGEKIEYQRMFLMLKQEDAGYGTNQNPSGYVKIEVRDDYGKMTIAVENLKEDIEQFGYKAYILRIGAKEIAYAHIGSINTLKNKGELLWEFNPHNIGMKDFSIDDFSAVAIILNFKHKENNSIICPLAAYRDKKLQWRERFGEILEKAENINRTAVKEKNDRAAAAMHVIEKSEKESDSHQFDFPKVEAAKTNAIPAQTDPVPPDLGRKVENCAYMDKKVCASESRPDGNNPCDHCFMNAEITNTQETSGGEVNLRKLKENLTKCFEICNPFGSRRRDYIWWKINNPAFLNNILYQCNIRTALLFNPKVMMAHFKYKYIIFGMYSDSLRHSEYVVCGVPGIYNVDDKPFGDMCRWVQLEGSRSRSGAFGYWLAYADPKTGKLINAN